MKIVTISGSLRQKSFNTALLATLVSFEPDDVEFENAAIAELPLYNDDLTGDALLPVQRFRAQITAADGVLIATPEYNYGIPGPLKNAIDWASRPAYQAPFTQKPVGILGASMGVVGTARGQGQLKQVLLGMASQVFPYPEVLVGQSGKKFDVELRLVDEDTLKHLQKFLTTYLAWVRKVR